MRDDLHRTVPLARPWRRVLRWLCRYRGTPEELALLIVAATQGEQNVAVGTVRRIARAVLEKTGDGLFDDSAEKVRCLLHGLLDAPLPPVERAVYEVALGCLKMPGLTPAFLDQVAQAAGMTHSRDAVEHMVARVAAEAGWINAFQVRRDLAKPLALCDFTQPVSGILRSKKKSDEHLMDTEPGLTL